MKTKKNKGEKQTYKGVAETFAPQAAQSTPPQETQEEPASQTRLRKQIARFIKKT